jgi:hypothetical protein
MVYNGHHQMFGIYWIVDEDHSGASSTPHYDLRVLLKHGQASGQKQMGTYGDLLV